MENLLLYKKEFKNEYTKDLVSVIIPSYERYEPLKIAINSVLDQTYKNIEIIVINDGSSDIKYKNLDKEYENYKNIKIIHLPVNTKKWMKVDAPQGAVRAIGCEIAQGEYIAFLDDDDAYLIKNKIELQMSLINKYKNVGNGHYLCSTNMFMSNGSYDKNTEYIKNINGQHMFNHKIGIELEPNVFSLESYYLEMSNFVLNSTVIVNHEIFNESGGIKAEQFEDWNCWIRISKNTNILYIENATTYYDNNHANKRHYSY